MLLSTTGRPSNSKALALIDKLMTNSLDLEHPLYRTTSAPIESAPRVRQPWPCLVQDSRRELTRGGSTRCVQAMNTNSLEAIASATAPALQLNSKRARQPLRGQPSTSCWRKRHSAFTALSLHATEFRNYMTEAQTCAESNIPGPFFYAGFIADETKLETVRQHNAPWSDIMNRTGCSVFGWFGKRLPSCRGIFTSSCQSNAQAIWSR